MANQHRFLMPMAKCRDAPTFSADASGFETFFEDVEELAVRANINDAEKIRWATRYAGDKAKAWKYVDCIANTTDANPATFAQFKKEVLLCYPHISSTRRHTIGDLERLVSSTREIRGMTRQSFGDFYRDFLTFTTYLITKERLSLREQNTMYLRALPPPIHSAILHRLEIKKPDVLPDEGYDFQDMYDASLHVLSAGDVGSDRFDTSATPVPKIEPVEQGHVGDLIQAMSELTRVFTANVQAQPRPRSPRPSDSLAAPGGASQSAPRWTQLSRPEGCMFCSGERHYARECPIADDYIRQKKIVRNDEGKLVLLDGNFIPGWVRGRNLRERIDNWYFGKEGPDPQETVAAHFLESSDELLFQMDIDPVSSSSTFSTSHAGPDEFDEYDQLQYQIDALREAQVLAYEKGKKKLQFAGVEIMQRVGPPKRDLVVPPPPSRPIGPTAHARDSSRPARDPPPTSDPLQSTTTVPNVFGKPGARAGDRPSPQRPQGPMRPVNIQPKPAASDPQFRYQSAIESSVKPSELANRALDATFTISARELLAALSDVRRHVKDLVASKKVAANVVEIDQTDVYLADCLKPSTPAAYLDLFKYDSTSSAASSLPLRVIFPTFAPGVEPECILDGGAQIVVMRRDVWERLRVPIVASRAMPMESANAATTMTLGVIENHPVQLGPITIYLQIQVVDNAPFEVLLGRPFFDVTSCSEVSTNGGKHEIRIKDPKDQTPYVFATEPRVRKPASKPPVAVNFR